LRIFELGKELGVDNKAIVDFLQKEGVKVNSQLNAVPEKMVEKIRANFSEKTNEDFFRQFLVVASSKRARRMLIVGKRDAGNETTPLE
jgi:hypothetical protein